MNACSMMISSVGVSENVKGKKKGHKTGFHPSIRSAEKEPMLYPMKSLFVFSSKHFISFTHSFFFSFLVHQPSYTARLMPPRGNKDDIYSSSSSVSLG